MGGVSRAKSIFRCRIVISTAILIVKGVSYMYVFRPMGHRILFIVNKFNIM